MTRRFPLIDAINEAGRKYLLASSGCVIAVSGGPDSVALLDATIYLYQANVTPLKLVVGHVNHQLRGKESDQDEEFVRALTRRKAARYPHFDIRFESIRIDVQQKAMQGRANLEGTARKLRYRWLTDLARSNDLRWVLTGHTLDDQAETTLFHILRGTGLRGLRGMRPRRKLADGVALLRPWLGVSKAEILAYLEAGKLTYRTDASNQDPQFTRNRLRRQLLPQLETEYNPRISSALAALASHAAHACRLLDAESKKLLKRAERPRVGNLLVFDHALLGEQSSEVLQATFAFLWKRERWPRSHMGRVGWVRLAEWVTDASPALDLPGGIRAVKKRSVVQLGPRK